MNRQATRKAAVRKRKSARGRPPADEAATRAARLLDVATEVFLEQGFKGASMSEIARRAGASKQTLYTRYPSKAALFAALVERKSSLLFEAIGVLGQDIALRDALLRFGYTLLTMILSGDARGLHRVVIAECIEFPELSEMFWDLGPGRMRATLVSYLRTQQNLGVLRPGNPEHAVEAFLGMLISTASLRTNLGLTTPLITSAAQRKAWVAFVVDMFLSAMQAAPPSTV
jgi:TetR/AcrR family transcriptional regulator, mexJK operon transcriptional repressor